MRFSASAVLALPIVGAAAQGGLDQYTAKFQNFIGNFGSYIPNPSRHDAVAAAEAKLGAMKMHTLTLDNWKETLYEPVKSGAATPEQWWLFITASNRTCFGHCAKMEAAFNETAAKFALLPSAPHVAMMNCESQPVLCNSWSAAAGALWIFEMLPPPAAVDIYQKHLNWTTTTSDTLMELYKSGSREGFKLKDGMFHPFDGFFAQNGLSTPMGYLLWAFNILPSWAIMIIFTFISRTTMARMHPGAGQQRAASQAEAVRRGPQPGDAAGAR